MKAIPTIKLTLLGLSALLFMPACEKYEEGPALSLRSKKARIANTWIISEATDDGRDVSSDYDQFELTLTRDGDASLLAKYSIGDFDFTVETDGTWDFTDDKESLRLDFEDDDSDATYQILRLKENELWLREEGEDLELKFESK